MKRVNSIIDTLEDLFLSKSLNKGNTLDIYKLRYNVILRIQDGQTKYNQLLDLGKELSELDLKKMGIEERINTCLISFACFKDTLSWKKAFNALRDTYKYAEFLDDGRAYVLYCFGRLLYDYEEMLDDINHFQEVLAPEITPTQFVIDNQGYTYDGIRVFYGEHTISEKQYQYLLSLLKHNLGQKGLESYNSERWFFPNLFFKNAKMQAKRTKMHYLFWYALAENKRGKYYFYKGKMDIAKKILDRNIENYEACSNAGGDLPANIIFNHAECLFFLAMSQLYLLEKVKEKLEVIDNLKKSIEKFNKAILLFDKKSIIDSEYTYRRSLSDYRHMYLVAINELIKVEKKYALKYEHKIRYNINGIMNSIRNTDDGKIEFYETFLELMKNFKNATSRELIIDDSQTFEKRKKALEKRPYKKGKPMRFGIAFNDNYYREIFWDKLM